MLSTDRLILREWRQEDLAPFVRLNADPEVMRFFPDIMTAKKTTAMVERIGAHFSAHGFGLWAAEIKETGEFIGFIGMHHVRDELPFCPAIEIGWRLSKDSWGKGYAQEGARAALAYAFSGLGLEEVVSFTAVVNQPSINVMKKVGMTRDKLGDFEHSMVPDGSPLKAHVLYRIKACDVIAS